MAMRLPKELNAREGEISITRQGNRWIVEPVKTREWPKDFFKQIKITDPDFERPDQGNHRSVEL